MANWWTTNFWGCLHKLFDISDEVRFVFKSQNVQNVQIGLSKPFSTHCVLIHDRCVQKAWYPHVLHKFQFKLVTLPFYISYLYIVSGPPWQSSCRDCQCKMSQNYYRFDYRFDWIKCLYFHTKSSLNYWQLLSNCRKWIFSVQGQITYPFKYLIHQS